MKKILKICGILFALGLVLGLTGCDSDPSWIDEIDWKNYNGTNAGFFADNLSNNRLVAFNGSVTKDNLLSGIPANTDNHGIYKVPSVFNRTRSITVVFVREKDLRTHYNNNTLPTLNENPFTSIMVLYNHGMENNHRYRISDRAGGRHRLIVANTTDHNVEFRINSPLAGGGDVLGFSPKLSHSTVFHLSDHTPPRVETMVFPVFRFFHPVNQAVSEIFPVWPSGQLKGTPWFRNLPTAADLPAVNETINIQTILNDFTLELGAVWLIIQNLTDTPINVFQGTTAIPNSMGTFQIPNVLPNNHRTMVFNARIDGAGQTMPSLPISNLGVGPTVAIRTADIKDSNGATSFDLLPDHRYTVRVEGSITGFFTATINLVGEAIDIKELLKDQE